MDVMQTVLPCQLSHYFLADLFPHLPLFSLSLSLSTFRLLTLLWHLSITRLLFNFLI